jgi:hypothetical protein
MSLAATAPDTFESVRRRRRQRWPRWVGPVALGAIVLGMVLLFVLRGPTISQRDRQNKIINVVLPPPPPPPPLPPPKEKPPEPEKPKVEEPKPTPVTPPPPSPTPPAANANDALSARVGAGPSNYGLAQGNGGGTRIGGGVGGDPLGLYANAALAEIRRAVQADPALNHSRFGVQLAIAVSADGHIESARFLQGSGDDKRDAALQRLLAGLQLSQRPPSGLPVMRIELNARPGL